MYYVEENCCCALTCVSAICINFSAVPVKANTVRNYVVNFDSISNGIVPFSVTYEVTSAGLKIRKKPGLSGKVVGYLRKGDLVSGAGDTAERVKDGVTWISVIRQSDGLSGWVSKKYLNPCG